MVDAIPKPGQYADVPFDEYLAWDAVNNSSLDELQRSALHYQWALEHPKPSTDAQRNGSWLHCGVLEPLAIAARFAVLPDKDFCDLARRADDTPRANLRGRTVYRELAVEWRRVNADKQEVSQEQYDNLLGVSAALHNSEATAYFQEPRQTEVSLVWDDATTGLRCKARLDMLREADRTIPDLKTSEDISRFEWKMWDFACHRQAAFYADGMYALTGEHYRPVIIAVESKPPYGVRVAPVGTASLIAGREQYVAHLKTIARCREAGHWPGYSSPESWDIPASKLPPPRSLTLGGQPVTVSPGALS